MIRHLGPSPCQRARVQSLGDCTLRLGADAPRTRTACAIGREKPHAGRCGSAAVQGMAAFIIIIAYLYYVLSHLSGTCYHCSLS